MKEQLVISTNPFIRPILGDYQGKLLKLLCMVQIIISFGLGYTKVYQLFTDVREAFTQVSENKNLSDFSWIPYLSVQLMTSVFQFIQFYCLIRELCEDNYMYKHCFKLTFTLTVLIYLISVFPKTVMSLVYKKWDLSLDEWRNKVTDFFDGLLNSMVTLTFQIILFMVVIKKALRSAGICRGSKIGTTDETQSSPNDEVHAEYCCFVGGCCFKKSESEPVQKATDQIEQVQRERTEVAAVETENETDGGPISAPVRNSRVRKELQKAKTVYREARNVSKRVLDTKRQIKTKIINVKEAKKKEIKQKIMDKSKQMKTKVEHKVRQTVVGKTKEQPQNEKQNITTISNISRAFICGECNESKGRSDVNDIKLETTDTQLALNIQNDQRKDNPAESQGKPNEVSSKPITTNNADNSNMAEENDAEALKICKMCGKAVKLGTDTPVTKDKEKVTECQLCVSCPVAGLCKKAKDAVCRFYERRALCFIITLTLAHLHLLLYMVELIFVFCVWC